MLKAVYGASLDIMTEGHLWVIKESARLFSSDELLVAVANNPAKKYMFSHDERVSMAAEVCRDAGLSSVRTAKIGNDFLVNFACDHGFSWMVRGIRNIQDYEFELAMQRVNSDINSKGFYPVSLSSP